MVNPKKELIGTNRYDVKSDDGKYNLKDMINFSIENKKGFIKYNSTVKLNDSLISNDKISFVKLVLNFMQEENLIFFDEERRIISITTRFKSIVYFTTVTDIHRVIWSPYKKAGKRVACLP